MKTLEDLKRDGWQSGINEVVMGDCLDGMKLIPDKSIDLILTDPPYGIGMSKGTYIGGGKGFTSKRRFERAEWDDKIPSVEVFDEMFRISKNQIIFGGNYFTQYLSPSRGWVFWHKKIHPTQGSNFADGELIWTSFDMNTRYFQHGGIGLDLINGREPDDTTKLHPTQKPTEVMRWILTQYSKETDLICDPFMGSWTTARACKDLGRNFIGFELEKKYCEVGEERLRQQNLF